MKRLTNRETISYLIVGGLTTVLAWGAFTLALHLGIGTVMSNNLANALAILFSFTANKIFVFRSPSWKARRVLPEFVKFCGARLLTHVLETAALFVLVDIYGLPGALMKGLTMIFIQMLGNYVLSKWVVFVGK